MTEEKDPVLQALFADAERPLADGGFTGRVMSRIDRGRRWALAARIGIGLALALCAGLAAPPLAAVADLLTQALALPLLRLDDPLVARLLAPVNNIAGLCVVGLAGLWLFYRSIFGADAMR